MLLSFHDMLWLWSQTSSSTSPRKFKVLKSQVSEVLTGFPTVMFGEKKGMFMIWCEKFRCATIGGYMIYLIKLYVMQIRYVLWCGTTVPPCPTMRKSRPHGCFYHDSTPQQHGDTKLAPSKRVQGPPPSRQVTRVSQAHACLNWWCQNQVLNFQVSERTPTCSRGFFWQRRELALRYFSKGSQKHLLAWGMCWVI